MYVISQECDNDSVSFVSVIVTRKTNISNILLKDRFVNSKYYQLFKMISVMILYLCIGQSDACYL